MTLTRIASALIGASALVVLFSANAAEPKAPAASAHHAAESAFPMKADAFKKLVDNRLDRLKSHLEQSLAHRSLTPEQKSEIGKAMDGAVSELHAAVDKVGLGRARDGRGGQADQGRERAAPLQDARPSSRGKHATKSKGPKAGGSKRRGKTAASKAKPLSKKTAKDAIVLPPKKTAKDAKTAKKADEK